MIIEKIIEYKKTKIKQWPCHSNRASEIGHPCERYLVFLRTRWQEKALHDVTLQFVFDEGNIHEDAVLATLAQAGIKTIEQQRSYEWQKYQITGHIDAKVLIDGKAIPLEIKSMSPFVFNSISTMQDMLASKYVYLQKYPAQMTLYMLMDNKDEGIFLLKNKVNGQLKEVIMTLDYDYGESLIQKAERVNQHVAAGTVPDPIEWSEEICGGCGFAQICLPEARRDALEIVDMPELEAKLKRREDLRPLLSEYERLDKEIRALLKEKEKVVIGNYLITGKWIDRKEYTIPAGTYWKTEIKSLSVKEGRDDE